MGKPIPVYQFSEAQPIIHFAHANGYPPACYQRMLAPLTSSHHILGIYHRPLWNGSKPEDITSWHDLADDLIDFLEQERHLRVIGIGHSLGAVVTMYAALKRPELFRALILIEPVFLVPAILSAMVKLNTDDKSSLSLSRIALSRRRLWPSRQAIFQHFRPKAIYARWSDNVLWDYVNNATYRDMNGDYVLTYHPEWEARIYDLPPHDVWDLISKIQHPTLAIRGAHSDTLVPAAWQMWRVTQSRGIFVEIEDSGHLVPMERPLAVANTIKIFLESLGINK